MLSLFGCFSQKPTYAVDYDGQKSFYKGAKDFYYAGETVEFSFYLIATDTDYSFFLDGERYNALYEDGRGYVIRFTMPEHDVTFTMESRNSMVWDGFLAEETLTYRSYDGGPTYTVTVGDQQVVACAETVEYDKPNHAELNGAGYDVTFTLTGKAPGTTTVTVSCDFKGEPTLTVYDVTVNEALQIRMEER